ncbi:uncharacterized protein LOC133805354 [Humulus lupulus]|uniref:uncharacterized protein LOC133805354 n=1 Tax=Humulus lupulus TaxID=3486 RepID=UPI002B4105FF|nr:uncharacterized protein LOC133805354 [Humulus lupulus]
MMKMRSCKLLMLEEKNVKDKDRNFECMDSLEERVSVFFDEHYCSGESDHHPCLEYDHQSNGDDPEERTFYWESQYFLLQEVLERYNLTGSKLRREIGRAIDTAKETDYCHCAKPKTIHGHGCNHCLRRMVVKDLREKGINASLCSSKWRHTKKIPQGCHEYIEVIGNTPTQKKQIPYIVEVEFRDQFEIAKPCDEYGKLLSLLPEYYIGKTDCLNAVVRIICGSAKRSMKEKKIHMGPWRETSFMLMKWSSTLPLNNFPPISPPSPSPSAKQSHFSAAPPAVVVT